MEREAQTASKNTTVASPFLLAIQVDIFFSMPIFKFFTFFFLLLQSWMTSPSVWTMDRPVGGVE
jgi:hypothetical protein